MNDPFFFGAATSSHQVEGNNHNNWSKWERENAKRLTAAAQKKTWDDHIRAGYPNPLQEENYISGRAADHYNRFREDFDIAKSLGHNAHRFSIEWSRVEPEEGVFDEKELEHYRAVIRELRNRDIEPFVTIWHWTLPLWLSRKGGVMDRRFPAYFRRFTETLVRAFGNDVRFWITINEPEIVMANSYYKGQWPPQKRNAWLTFRGLHTLMRAHRSAYDAIKAATPEAQVGPVMDMVHFEADEGLINHLLKRLADRMWNSYFFLGVMDTADFIGLNFYFHNRISRWYGRNRNERISDMGWELYPESLYHLLLELKLLFGKPIYITENGLADNRDKHREYFIAEHLSAMKKAIEKGVDVRGYFHWSLLDNFEWDSGFWPRFGLVEIDYKTMERRIRPSALKYKQHIEAWLANPPRPEQ
ncbi:MAG TPA: family 1 glycosylhydrolase [Candidatus Paceibacterota bacterium]|nr:family 1 glycosylhydrolase [Candidatus Paceibacterota bacterium]